jgi:hypothetical protein
MFVRRRTAHHLAGPKLEIDPLYSLGYIEEVNGTLPVSRSILTLAPQTPTSTLFLPMEIAA